ncbi:hypothetical protein JCM21900_000569 [Sporobolomyces salmonicolor]
MAWSRGSAYSLLPNSPSFASSADFAPRSNHEPMSRQRWTRLYLMLSALALVVLSSVALVPHEHLPERVQQAIGQGWEAYESAKQGVATGWRWTDTGTDDAEVEMPEDEAEPGLWDGAVETAVEGGDLDHAVLLPVETGSTDEAISTSDGAVSLTAAEPTTVHAEVVCSDEVRSMLGEASFWTVAATSPLNYEIRPRNRLPSDLPAACLSQTVFSARLISSGDSLESIETQTVIALPSPTVATDFSSYGLRVPSDLAVPNGTYEVEIRLEFGFFPGVQEGAVCGEMEKTCRPLEVSQAEGDQLKYLGHKVEVVDGRLIEVGVDNLATNNLPLCTDFSSFSGYWSSLTYHPTSPVPCDLFDPSFPVPFVPTPTPASDSTPPSTKTPLWIHFIGDSNMRNMYSHLVSSFGNGLKINAPKLTDSPTHNGTVATYASRWRGGEIPTEGDGVPDVILTWSWWYQMSPVTNARAILGGKEAAWTATIEGNRDDLLHLANATLESYLAYSHISFVTASSPALSEIAKTLRPHRTFLSLGSHSERLSLAGVASSLDVLLSPVSGLSPAKRDAANLRFFTTTFVNPSYIPLARFPHQDLLRNNALIAAKNAYAASRPELGGEGRVVDIEKMTRGIASEEKWMKEGNKGRGPDAVHFRAAVYDEWVRVVWTELMVGLQVPASVDGVEETRKRWKRRIDWQEAEEDDD